MEEKRGIDLSTQKALAFFGLPEKLNPVIYSNPRRHAGTVIQRHFVAYRLNLSLPLVQVARLFKQHHSTIVHSRRTILDLLDVYPHQTRAVLNHYDPQIVEIYGLNETQDKEIKEPSLEPLLSKFEHVIHLKGNQYVILEGNNTFALEIKKIG